MRPHIHRTWFAYLLVSAGLAHACGDGDSVGSSEHAVGGETPAELVGAWVSVAPGSVTAISCYDLASDGAASLWLALDGIPPRNLFDDGQWSYAAGVFQVAVNADTETYQAQLELDEGESSFVLTDSSGRISEFIKYSSGCADAMAVATAPTPDPDGELPDPNRACLWDSVAMECIERAVCDGCVPGGSQPSVFIAPDDPVLEPATVRVFGSPALVTEAKLVLSTTTRLCGSYALSAVPATSSGELTVAVPTECAEEAASGDLRIELTDVTSSDQFGYVAVDLAPSSTSAGEGGSTTAGGSTTSGGDGSSTSSGDSGSSTGTGDDGDSTPSASCTAAEERDCTGVAGGERNACGTLCLRGDFYGDMEVADGSGTVVWAGDVQIVPGTSRVTITSGSFETGQ